MAMREHLFRGKRTDNGEWIYGDLLQCPESNIYTIMPITPISENIQIVPETHGEFTGMCDKNGVKIFEDDIVNDGHISVVKWLDEYSCFAKTKGEIFEYMNVFARYTEVIGNIFDDPELIGGEINGNI